MIQSGTALENYFEAKKKEVSITSAMYRILSYKHHISVLGDRHTDKGLLC